MIRLSHNGANRLAGKMTKLARTDLHRALVNSTERSARVVQKDLQDTRFAGKPIKTRSGLTRASIRTAIDRGRNPGAAVGTPMKHVPVLERGATIRARRAQYLTIPLRGALTAGGKSRGTARQVGALYDHTFVLKRRGKRIIMGVRKGQRPVPLFLLKKSVRIPAKRPFEIAHRSTGVGVVRIYDREVAQALR